MFYKQRRNESAKLNDIPWDLTLLKTGLISITCLMVMATNRELKQRLIDGYILVNRQLFNYICQGE